MRQVRSTDQTVIEHVFNRCLITFWTAGSQVKLDDTTIDVTGCLRFERVDRPWHRLEFVAGTIRAVLSDLNEKVILGEQGDDASATATLGAAQAAVTVGLAGRTALSFSFPAAANLIGTLTSEYSLDGGDTWSTAYTQQGGGTTTTTQTVSGGPVSWLVLVPGGSSHARVRVSAYTSGSAVATLRATDAEPVSLTANVPGSAAPYTQRVQDTIGASSTFGEVLVLTTATQIIASAATSRKFVALYNNGPNPIYWGKGNTVTAANGFPLAAGTSVSIPADKNLDLYAICGVAQLSGAGTRYFEGA